MVDFDRLNRETHEYNYFYAVGDDNDIFEICGINEYYFDENGDIIY